MRPRDYDVRAADGYVANSWDEDAYYQDDYYAPPVQFYDGYD
jgi:hypothetical protein